MAAKPTISGGRVAIELDGKPFELVPSLAACVEISALGGGLNAAVQRCANMHFETICAIVGAGLEIDGRRLNGRQRDDMIPKAVYEAGLIGISAKCIEFCRIIANGGQPIEADDDSDDDEGEAGGPLAESPLGNSTSESSKTPAEA